MKDIKTKESLISVCVCVLITKKYLGESIFLAKDSEKDPIDGIGIVNKLILKPPLLENPLPSHGL